MAKKTVTTTTLTDDFDGSPAAETIAYSYRGESFEIDLNKANAKEFDQLVHQYIEHSRKVRNTRGRRTAGIASKRDLSAIREWARANGHSVSDRGRISLEVVQAYEAAK